MLTEQEIRKVALNASRESGVTNPSTLNLVKFARAIESAVLEKLKAQKPFAFHHDEEGLSYSNHYTGTVPLYKRPLQPADVVRDAERYQWISVADRLPDPEVSVLVAREGRRLAEKTCHTGKEWLLESNNLPVTHWMILPMTPQTRSEWEQLHAGIKNAAVNDTMKEMK